MGDRTHVTLTLRQKDHDRIKQEDWFYDGEDIEEAGSDLSGRVGNKSRNLDDNDALVFCRYEEVNYADLGFEDTLNQQAIPFVKEWDHGGDYNAGCAFSLYTPEGDKKEIDFEYGQERMSTSELMKLIDDIPALTQHIRNYHAAFKQPPWKGQGHYAKLYQARKLLQPNE